MAISNVMLRPYLITSHNSVISSADKHLVLFFTVLWLLFMLLNWLRALYRLRRAALGCTTLPSPPAKFRSKSSARKERRLPFLTNTVSCTTSKNLHNCKRGIWSILRFFLESYLYNNLLHPPFWRSGIVVVREDAIIDNFRPRKIRRWCRFLVWMSWALLSKSELSRWGVIC